MGAPGTDCQISILYPAYTQGFSYFLTKPTMPFYGIVSPFPGLMLSWLSRVSGFAFDKLALLALDSPTNE